MSVHKNSPRIVTNGLVLLLDAANPKSYVGTGTSWKDLSGNANNGTLTGGPTFNSANVGSFSFDGVNDYAHCGNAASLNFGTGNFTVCAWVKRGTSATTNLRVLAKGAEGNDANQAGFCFFGSDTSLTFAVNPSTTRTIIVAATHVVDEWFYVSGLVERGGSLRTYKNGVLTNSTTAPSGSVSNAIMPLYIGASTANDVNPNLFFKGNIPHVALYNRALTTTEILQNYEATRRRYGI
jgi:hypothetical protein